MTAAPLLETRQAFGSSLKVSLRSSRGGRPEGALGYGPCRRVRQGSSGEVSGGGNCHLFPESSNAPASTLTLKSCAILLSWALCARQMWSGGLTVFWFMAIFEHETIRQKCNPIRHHLAGTDCQGGQERRKRVSPGLGRPPCPGQAAPCCGHRAAGGPVPPPRPGERLTGQLDVPGYLTFRASVTGRRWSGNCRLCSESWTS